MDAHQVCVDVALWIIYTRYKGASQSLGCDIDIILSIKTDTTAVSHFISRRLTLSYAHTQRVGSSALRCIPRGRVKIRHQRAPRSEAVVRPGLPSGPPGGPPEAKLWTYMLKSMHTQNVRLTRSFYRLVVLNRRRASGSRKIAKKQGQSDDKTKAIDSRKHA